MRPLALLYALVLAGPALADETECIDYSEHVSALRPLEPVAIRGGLDQAALTCLEIGYLNAQSQTDKGKISRVLMANAYVTNTSEWARLVKRHLDEVEQSDPDISYLYANYLYNRPDADFQAVIRFADMAWDRRADRWEGETFTTRSRHLLRLRTMARMQLWKQAEDGAVGGGDTERAKADEVKVRAHASAREWLDFERAADLDWLDAAEACVATGNESACGLRDGWRAAAVR